MVKIPDSKTSNNIHDPTPYWGLQHDISPRLGARLVQQGAYLHFLRDRAGCVGTFSPEAILALELAFPVLVERLEALLRSGKLDPRPQRCVTVYHSGFICEADTLGSFGYLYIAVYQAEWSPVAE